MAKQRTMLALLCMIMLLLGACARNTSDQPGQAAGQTGEPPESPAAAAQTRSVKHLRGTTDIPSDPQRIVSINLEDMLLALDVPLVLATPIDRQDYLNAELQKRGVKLAPFGESVNMEAVLEANPDLIIATGVLDDAVYEQLNKIAPTIAYSRSDWRTSIVQIGQALGIEAKAKEVVEAHEQKIAAAKTEIAGLIGSEPKTAFLRMQEKDLRLFFPSVPADPNPYAGYVSIAYKGLGFAADPYVLELQQQNPKRQNAPVSLEVLPRLTADYLFVIALGSDGSDEALQKTLDELEAMKQSGVWKSIPAVKQDRVYVLNMKNWLVEGPHAESLKINELLQVLKS